MKMSDYERLLKSKEEFDVTFVSSDLQNAMLHCFDGNIIVNLPMNDAMAGRSPKEYARLSMSYVGINISVMVTAIDKTNNTVTCSRRLVKKTKREQLVNSIDERLEKKEVVTMDATIISVNGSGSSSYVRVRLSDGLLGIVRCRDWSTDYTPDVSKIAQIGDTFPVVVMARNTDAHLRVNYNCSRELAMPNPWIGIEEKFHYGDIISVLVTERITTGANKGNFRGTVPGLSDITVCVITPSKEERNLRIVPGITYQCDVVQISEKSKRFNAHPFRPCVLRANVNNQH